MQKILVLGDSHTLAFQYIQERLNAEACVRYDNITVAGATSQGVKNPYSKTNALQSFKEALATADDYDYVMTMLGEVDCGFAIWHYADNYGVSVDEQLERSLASYREFLIGDILTKFDPHQVVVIGSILPTIQDQTDRRFMKGSRASVKTGIKERTDLTLRYNRRIEEMAGELGMKYIDITEETYDADKGSVKTGFLNENPFDHHLSNEATAPIWHEKVMALIRPDIERHVAVCGFPKSGEEIVASWVEGYWPSHKDVSMVTTLQCEGNVVTHRASDISMLKEAIAKNKRFKEINVICIVRDPRSLLVEKNSQQEYLIDGLANGSRLGIVDIFKEIVDIKSVGLPYVAVRLEDALINKNAVYTKIFNTLNIPMNENGNSKLNGLLDSGNYDDLMAWRKPSNRARIIDQFTKYPDLFVVLQKLGYEQDTKWFERLLVEEYGEDIFEQIV